MIDQKKYEKFFDAFTKRDYETCADLGLQMVATGLNRLITMHLIISLRRLGREETKVELATRVLLALENLPFEQMLTKLVSNAIPPLSESKLSEYLSDKEKICQYYYYRGHWYIDQSHPKLAIISFVECINTKDVESAECQLAKVELKHLDPSHPLVKNSGNSEREKVLRSLAGVPALIAQERWSEALETIDAFLELPEDVTSAVERLSELTTGNVSAVPKAAINMLMDFRGQCLVGLILTGAEEGVAMKLNEEKRKLLEKAKSHASICFKALWDDTDNMARAGLINHMLGAFKKAHTAFTRALYLDPANLVAQNFIEVTIRRMEQIDG